MASASSGWSEASSGQVQHLLGTVAEEIVRGRGDVGADVRDAAPDDHVGDGIREDAVPSLALPGTGLRRPMLRDVGEGVQDAAIGQGHAPDLQGGAVRTRPVDAQGRPGTGGVAQARPAVRGGRHRRKVAALRQMGEDIGQARPLAQDRLGQIEELAGPRIEQADAALRVHHDQALVHGLQGRAQAQVLLPQLRLGSGEVGDVEDEAVERRQAAARIPLDRALDDHVAAGCRPAGRCARAPDRPRPRAGCSPGR